MGVFELADESLDEPPQQLNLALSEVGLEQHQFHPLKIGERIALQDSQQALSIHPVVQRKE